MPLDPDHPLLRPIWVRLLLVAVPLLGAATSFSQGSVGWSLPFIALGGWLFQRLILGPAGRRDDDDGEP